MEPLLLIPSLLLAFLLYQQAQDRASERREWADERRYLLNRIQAPKTAAYQASDDDYSDEQLHVPPDLDSAWEQFVDDRAEGKAV